MRLPSRLLHPASPCPLLLFHRDRAPTSALCVAIRLLLAAPECKGGLDSGISFLSLDTTSACVLDASFMKNLIGNASNDDATASSRPWRIMAIKFTLMMGTTNAWDHWSLSLNRHEEWSSRPPQSKVARHLVSLFLVIRSTPLPVSLMQQFRPQEIESELSSLYMLCLEYFSCIRKLGKLNPSSLLSTCFAWNTFHVYGRLLGVHGLCMDVAAASRHMEKPPLPSYTVSLQLLLS